jgi:hypothetical protein
MPKTPQSAGERRLEVLEYVKARMPGDIRELLREARSRRTYGSYCSFLKSLDGAIRNAQRLRDKEQADDSASMD